MTQGLEQGGAVGVGAAGLVLADSCVGLAVTVTGVAVADLTGAAAAPLGRCKGITCSAGVLSWA